MTAAFPGLTLDEVADWCSGEGFEMLEISSLAYYPNNLHPDEGVRAEANGHLRKVIDAAAALGVRIVGTFVGRDKARSLAENFAVFREVWPPLVEYAGQRG